MGQGGGVGKGLRAIRGLGEVVNGLITLDGGGQAGGDQQGTEKEDGKQPGKGASQHDNVLSKGERRRSGVDGEAKAQEKTMTLSN